MMWGKGYTIMNCRYQVQDLCFVYAVQQETFEGENFHGSVRSDHFAENTFVECYRWVQHTPNFVDKTFADGSKTTKFINVFSFESFSSYGTTRLVLVQFYI